METIAFYRETIIKTYGFFEKTGLTLITIEVSFHQAMEWGARLLDLPPLSESSLILLIARPLSGTIMRLNLVLDEGPREQIASNSRRYFLEKEFKGLSWREEKEVEMVFFQGPHFGDRYGIACEALSSVASHDISLLAAACIGATVFLVVPKGMAKPTCKALTRAFTVPDSSRVG